MEEKILTRHPEGKKGVNISKAKYDLIHRAIVGTLESGPLPFSQLADRIEADLGNDFDGSVPWYVVTVKLDMEARGVIERIPKTSPQQLRLVEDPKT